jgi:hypothetical protein
VIHPNSIAALRQEQAFSCPQKRETLILESAKSWPGIGTFTDREMMQYLKLPDMNAVRPRITEMVERGLLVECQSVIDSVTGKRVRTCRLATCTPAAANPVQVAPAAPVVAFRPVSQLALF